MFTKMFYFLKAESFYKSNLAVIVQQPNKMTNCRTEFVETLRFTGMLQSGLEDYNNISDGIFPNFTTPL